jgi:hypothetical protein
MMLGLRTCHCRRRVCLWGTAALAAAASVACVGYLDGENPEGETAGVCTAAGDRECASGDAGCGAHERCGVDGICHATCQDAQDCATCEECVDGFCVGLADDVCHVPLCDPQSCPSGCCAGDVCLAPAKTTCGQAGAACVDCSAEPRADACSTELGCICTAIGALCPTGQYCVATGCVATCAPGCVGKCGGPDGCGGVCPDTCAAPRTCGGAGIANVCGSPTTMGDFSATQPNPILTFAAFSDAHQQAVVEPYNDQTVFRSIVVQINKLKPAFVLSAGDAVDTGSLPEDWATLEAAIAPLEINPIPAGLPSYLFPATGGHEYCGSDSTKSRYSEVACDNFRTLFPFLGGLRNRAGKTQNYYAFSYGNNYFIVLNTYDHLYQLGAEGVLETSSAQYQWYAGLLPEATRFANVFIVGHDGPYLSQQKDCGVSYRGIVNVVNKANIGGHNLTYLGGHDDNLYGFFDCEGGDGGCKKTMYFVTAGATGDNNLPGACTVDQYANDVRARNAERVPHFMRFAVNGTTMRVTVFSEQGVVLHDFYLVDQAYTGPSAAMRDSLACDFDQVCDAAQHENEFNCPGDCTAVCTAFEYSEWGPCTSTGTQTRTVLDSSPAGCAGGFPITSRVCRAQVTCE